jgi:carbonic anhydrase
MRRLDEGICEMRRLYVRPEFRGRGLGRVATVALCREAHRLGYRKMRLITIPFMVEAVGIYRSLGFREIAAYRPTNAKEPCYMEADLGEF